MQRDCARGARQRECYTRVRTGFRRLTPGLLAADHAAEDFKGLPNGVEHHGELLAAFKAAAPRLGLSVRLVHAIDWLLRFTQAQDWERGRRPVVWPSALTQQDAFGLSESGVRSINRGVIDAGLITMRDSPNGKRYGVRDRHGQIVEAYGFDLCPIATRHAEFVQLAAEAKVEREMIGRLRRRATIARKAIAQILETVAEYGFDSEEWARLRLDCQALIKSLHQAERPEEITIGVGSLERRQTEARLRLEQLLDMMNTTPKPAENCGHSIPTKPPAYHEHDTVVADRGCKPDQGIPASTVALQGERPDQRASQTRQQSEGNSGIKAEPGQATEPRDRPQNRPPRPADDKVMRLTTQELIQLAPRLRPYLASPRPAWPEIIDAADWLRGEMDVSKSLWGEACMAMGREEAAIAVAIVSAKPAAHFRSTPGGYLHGMVAKARAGELNLARTIWGLRKAASKGRRERAKPVSSRPLLGSRGPTPPWPS